jgi:hypothetical protein
VEWLFVVCVGVDVKETCFVGLSWLNVGQKLKNNIKLGNLIIIKVFLSLMLEIIHSRCLEFFISNFTL